MVRFRFCARCGRRAMVRVGDGDDATLLCSVCLSGPVLERSLESFVCLVEGCTEHPAFLVQSLQERGDQFSLCASHFEDLDFHIEIASRLSPREAGRWTIPMGTTTPSDQGDSPTSSSADPSNSLIAGSHDKG